MDAQRLMCSVLVLVTLISASANAINCYKCKYNSSSNSDPDTCIDTTKPRTKTSTCSATQGCLKIYTIYNGTGQNTITRDCYNSDVNATATVTDVCLTSAYSNGTIQVACTCSTDRCNDAIAYTASYAMTFVMLLFFNI
jgi:hypothetical protein